MQNIPLAPDRASESSGENNTKTCHGNTDPGAKQEFHLESELKIMHKNEA